MQGSLNRRFTDNTTQTFTRRCHDLGLVVYHPTDTPGPLACSAPAQSPYHAWYTRAGLTTRIQAVLDEEGDGTLELEPGVFLIRLNDTHGTGRRFGLLVLTFRTTQAEGFDHRCRADGLSAEACRGALSTTPRHKFDELGALAKALAWNLEDLREMDQHRFATEDLTEQLGQSFENITLLYRLGRSMSSLDTPRRVAESVCHQVRETQGFGWVSAYFHNNNLSVPDLSGHCLISGELPVDRDTFAQHLGPFVQDWDSDNWSKLLQPGQNPIADLVRSEVICDPIHHDNEVVGVVMAGGKRGPNAEATSNDTQLLDAIAAFLGTFHENAGRFNEQQMMFIGTLETVSAALDAKDPYTYGHSDRVAQLGVQLAQAIGLEEQEVERIRVAGLVHDVGKIGVPESVLCKPGKLTDKEYEQIKRHPRIGYNILKGIPKMQDVLDGVLYHHERWDGRGYPDRLSGEDIPLYGRILAVADTFDAMSSTRSYRQAMPRAQVLEEILRCAGSQFDPQLTGPFVGLDFTEFDRMVRHHEGLASRAA